MNLTPNLKGVRAARLKIRTPTEMCRHTHTYIQKCVDTHTHTFHIHYVCVCVCVRACV